jgi:6-phosphogluconolactonase (cycloisomerase 2 family)
MTKTHLTLLLAVQLLLAFSLGCGSSGTMSPPPPPPSQSDFVYISTFPVPPDFNSQLMSFKLDLATGALKSTSTGTVSLLAFGLAVDPATKFLYVSDSDPVAPAIDIFSIDPKTGAPTPNGAFSLTMICPFCAPVSGPGSLAMDPKGKFFYYGSSASGGVTEVVGGLSGAGTASLNTVPGSPFAADDTPFNVQVHPNGNYLYTVNVSNPPALSTSISGFSIDSSTGALTPVPGSPFKIPLNANVSGFAIHPSGRYIYVSTAGAANGILAWSIDTIAGTLAVLPASPFAPGTTPVGIAIDPTGKFLYSSNAVSGGGISGFTIDTGSGSLTSMAGSPFDTGALLTAPAIDPSGKFLISFDVHNKAIVIFSIDTATGSIQRIGSPTPLDVFPAVLTVAKAPQ